MALCYDEAVEWLNGDSTESRGAASGVLSAAAKVTVVVGGTHFSVKKRLLTRNCDYFRALYRSGMKECWQDEIHLKCLSPLGFLIALGVLRGARPMLDGDQIVEAVECAAFLQVSQLSKHLVDLVDSDNCLLMYHTAATFGLMELYHAAAQYIRNMYGDLKAEVKMHLPPELVSHVESLSPGSLVAVGRHATCGIDETVHVGSRTLWHLDENGNEWKALTDLPPEASTAMAGVTVLDNNLYVVGGVQGGGRNAAETCFCYSAESAEWSQIASLNPLRYNFTLVGHEGYLYAIGGEYDGQVMSSVEAYEVKTGRWTFAAHLPRAAAGAAWAQAMGRMFVCLWKPKDTTDIYEYLPGQDRWTRLTTLIRQQSYGHCMAGHRDNLYVMRNMRNDFLRCMIDCYNLTTGQWAALPGHFGNSKGALFTSVVRGDSVFTLNRAVTLEYVIEEKEWRTRHQLKGFPRSGSVLTFLLRLPKNHSQQLPTQCSGSQTASRQGPEHSFGDGGKVKQQEG